MLSRVQQVTVGMVLLLSGLVAGAPAQAAPTEACKVVTKWDEATKTWISAVECPGTPGGSATPTSPTSGSACLDDFLKPIPCILNGAAWAPAWGCYAGASGQVPDAAHQGMTAYQCKFNVAGGALASGLVPIYWLASAPAIVDPAVLASQALAAMRLGPIRIGMVPDESPGSMGIVGVPVWLWVDAPDARTFGPATSSASAGGVTVTATARVSKVVWSMGDGKAVTCTSAGSVFRSGDGGKRSPDCGYTYTKQGTYTIRATSMWAITWSATTGVTGSMALSFTSTRVLVVGEIQVVTR